MKINQIREQIELKLKELEALRQQEKEFQELTDTQKLAELLHEKLCRWNHTDGCGWFYEKWTDKLPNHSDKLNYLGKAGAILHGIRDILPSKPAYEYFNIAKKVVENL